MSTNYLEESRPEEIFKIGTILIQMFIIQHKNVNCARWVWWVLYVGNRPIISHCSSQLVKIDLNSNSKIKYKELIQIIIQFTVLFRSYFCKYNWPKFEVIFSLIFTDSWKQICKILFDRSLKIWFESAMICLKRILMYPRKYKTPRM